MHLVHDLPKRECGLLRRGGEFVGSLGIVRERECDDLIDDECLNPTAWHYILQQADMAQRVTPYCIVPPVPMKDVFYAFIQITDSRYWFEPIWANDKPIQLGLTRTPRTLFQFRFECKGAQPKDMIVPH